MKVILRELVGFVVLAEAWLDILLQPHAFSDISICERDQKDNLWEDSTGCISCIAKASLYQSLRLESRICQPDQ